MARFLIVGGFLAVIFWVFSLVDCALQPPTRHRGVSKGAWIAIVILIPVLGGILWFTLGRARNDPGESSPLVDPYDDDDDDLSWRVDQAIHEARIAGLQEELARLEEEERDDGTEPRT